MADEDAFEDVKPCCAEGEKGRRPWWQVVHTVVGCDVMRVWGISAILEWKEETLLPIFLLNLPFLPPQRPLRSSNSCSKTCLRKIGMELRTAAWTSEIFQRRLYGATSAQLPIVDSCGDASFCELV